MHLNKETDIGEPIHFNYAVQILRENMMDYDIRRVKLVSIHTWYNIEHASSKLITVLISMCEINYRFGFRCTTN
jgi:hypothetical protein